MTKMKLVFFLLLLWCGRGQSGTGGIGCLFGHFRTQNNSCVECLLSCSSCEGLGTPCKKCPQGFKLVETSEASCKSCGSGLLVCDSDKILCQRYYKIEKGICNPLCAVENCHNCESIFSKSCVHCTNGYTLNENKTLCTQISVNQSTPLTNVRNLQQQRNNPIKLAQNPQNTNCLVNEYLDLNSQCQKCGPKCSTCINSADQCLSCSEGHTFVGWKCITNEYLEYNMTLGVPNGQEKSALTEGINLIKSKLLSDVLPTSYAGVGASAISLVKALLDPKTNRLSLNGIIDKVGNVNISELSNTIGNKLKQITFMGPFALLSSNVKLPQKLLNVTPSVNNLSPSSDQGFTFPRLAMILIPSIILGLILLCALLCCLLYCCKCCCFKEKKLKFSGVQAFQSERRLTSPKPASVITQITPVRVQKQPEPVLVRKMPTITSTTSIPFGQLKRETIDDVAKMKRMVSLDSLENENMRQQRKEQKIKISRHLTLQQSALDDKPIRTVIERQKNEVVRVAETFKPGDIIREYVRDGQMVAQRIEQTSRMEILPSDKYKYHYINSKGEEIPIKNLPDYMKSPDNLRNFNIRSRE